MTKQTNPRRAGYKQRPLEVMRDGELVPVRDLHDADWVRLKTVLRIIGGDTTPIDRTTLRRKRLRGEIPDPVVHGRIYKWNVGAVRRALGIAGERAELER